MGFFGCWKGGFLGVANYFVFSFASMISYLISGRIKRMLAFLVVFAAGIHAWSQEVTSFTTSEGLAHTNVITFFHDPDGYLWIGTWDGLSRFDGHSFTTYRSDVDGNEYFSRRIIEKIQKDKFGKIWILTNFELVRYDAESDDFINLEFMHKYDRSKGDVPDISFDDFGNGWCVFDKGLFRFDPVTFSNHFIDISDFHVVQSSLLADEKGLWIGASHGLLRFPYSTLMAKDILTVADAEVWYRFEDHEYSKKVFSVIKSRNENLLMTVTNLNAKNTEVFKTIDHDSVLRKIPLPDFFPANEKSLYLSINEISPNKILVTTEYPDLAIYNLENGAYEYDHPLKESLGNRSQYHTYSDHQHNLWIGGIDGMFKYALPQLNFKSWVFAPGKEGAISGKRINSVFKDNKNHLWVGSSDGGLERIDLANNSIKKITLPDSLERYASSTKVFNVFLLNDDELLVNFDTALFLYNIPQNRFSFVKSVDYLVYTFFRDSQDRIWISERNKLVVLDFDDFSEKNKFSAVNFHLYPTNTRQIYEARNGQFWLACGHGLVKLNLENPDESKLNVLPGNITESEVICIHETKEGLLWLGTLRQGIFLFDPKTEQFTEHFSTENGLIDNSVNKIYEDKNGHLWMSTWKGLARYNPADSSITNYSTVNGLPFPEFNTNAHFMDEDGTIYFGGEGGVVAFHPDSVVNFEISSPLGIQSINANNGLLPLDYPLRNGAIVELPYDKNSFSITFSAFDLRHPQDRIYRYRLTGWTDEWQQNNSGNLTAHFAGLKAGKYIFELQSTYKGWPWILEKTTLILQVENPPLLQRKAFQAMLLIALALSFITIIILRLRNNSIRKEMMIARLEKESNLSRLNFLKSQMNPHFYFNTLNAINNFVLRNDARSANKYLTKFAKLMREILENSQKDFVKIEEEQNVLENYISLQHLRFPNTFNYRITVDDQVKDKNIPPMLVQPFVENAIEYAFVELPETGFIAVNFELKGRFILCSIADNGIGIEKSQVLRARRTRKSSAIQNIRQRIQMLNSVYNFSIKIEIHALDPENENFPGTLVELLFPIIENPISETNELS